MSIFEVIVVTAVTAAVALAGDSPRLGAALNADEAAAGRFTVYPDGEGLPAGGGSAEVGERVYRTHCLACHGPEGENGPNDRLAGGQGSLDGPLPVKTVGSFWPYAPTLFSYIRRAMPYQAPGSLSDDDIYALTAYLLYVNGIITRDTEMNARSLPEVKMPNRDNFVWVVSPD